MLMVLRIILINYLTFLFNFKLIQLNVFSCLTILIFIITVLLYIYLLIDVFIHTHYVNFFTINL